MVGAAGLEPATVGLEIRCSIHLSYAPAPAITYILNVKIAKPELLLVYDARMKKYAMLSACLVFLSSGMICAAQTTKCMDVSEEPHHHLIFDDKNVRVFSLELRRLESTLPHCHSHAYLYIVTGESSIATTREGEGTFSKDLRTGDARFIYPPVKHVVRNDMNTAHRQIVIESLRTIQRQIFEWNYDTDEFPSETDPHKPTWSVSFSRGGLTAIKSQLAAGDHVTINKPDHLLIALSELELKKEIQDKPPSIFKLAQGEAVMLPGGSTATLTNSGRESALLVTVEF